MATQSPQVARKTTIAPMLSVRRGAQAVAFYQAAFGADVLFRVDGEGGGVVAQLSVAGGESDAMFERAVAAGAKIVEPVAKQPYGWHVGRVVDPYGHHWEIGKPR